MRDITARRVIPGLFLSLFGADMVLAQNLVPNGGFEDVLECPDWQSQLDRTAFWFDPSEGGTPDFYHACGVPWYSVPDNTVGFQEAVDGQAYAGIFLWLGNVLFDWREYLEVELAAPLVQGQCYRFRMHANLGDFSGVTTDDLGVVFATDSILADDPHPPGMVPPITLAPGAFLSREEWSVVEGEYIANGGERFLMIGNYLFDAETSTQELPPGPPNTGNFAYCFVDSVSLTPCGAIALGLEEGLIALVDGPMPIGDRLCFRTLPSGAIFIVRDALGRIMAEGAAVIGSIDVSTWPAGTYVLEVRSLSDRVVNRVQKR